MVARLYCKTEVDGCQKRLKKQWFENNIAGTDGRGTKKTKKKQRKVHNYFCKLQVVKKCSQDTNKENMHDDTQGDKLGET